MQHSSAGTPKEAPMPDVTMLWEPFSLPLLVTLGIVAVVAILGRKRTKK